MKKLPVTVSIATYNPGEDIIRCLNALLAQTMQPEEIIIIDNGSQDGSIPALEEKYTDVRFVKNKKNLGFGAAHNQGISAASQPWVLVLNQDVKLAKDALEKMYPFTKEDDIAVIGPVLFRDEDHNIVDTAGLKKTWYFKVSDIGSEKEVRSFQMSDGKVWGISGSCALYRVDALKQVAYRSDNKSEFFDENFFMYKEDVDLAARLQKAGWNAYTVKKATGVHQRTGAKGFVRRKRPEYLVQHSYKNHLYFLIKHAPIFLLPVIIPYEAAKLTFLLVTDPRSLKLVGDVRKNLSLMIKRRYA